MSGQGHNRLLLAMPTSHAVIESRQINVLRVGNSPGDLEQDRSQVRIAFGGLATEPFAPAVFVSRTHSRPRRNMLVGGTAPLGSG